MAAALTAIWQKVAVKLVGVRKRVYLPGAGLHDETGRYWPKCSVLISSFNKLDTPVDPNDEAADYFGADFETLEGRVTLPPKAISEWKEVGEIEVLFYVRDGLYAPGGYHHAIGKRRMWNLWRSGEAFLYRYGGAHRVELGKGCIVDSRGVVHP